MSAARPFGAATLVGGGGAAARYAGAMRRSFALLSVLLLTACSPGGHTLEVLLRTDYVPGIDFDEVRTTLSSAGGDRTDRRVVVPGEDFVGGLLVAEFSGLPVGSFRLDVELVRRGTPTGPRAAVTVEVRADLRTIVAITRSCRGVECPGEGDPVGATACVAGRCVDPSCPPDECPGECTLDVECDVTVACAVAQCVEGVCLRRGDSGRCGAGFYCDPEVGCRELPPDVDAGPPDAGRRDAGPAGLDAGPPDLDAGPPGSDAGRPDAGSPPTPDGGSALCGTRCDRGPCQMAEYVCAGGPPICTTTGFVRDGSSCAPDAEGSWSPCSGFSDACDDTGSQGRDVTRFACQRGACAGTTTPETRTCTRTTDPATCCGVCGDVNGNGTVSTADLVTHSRVEMGTKVADACMLWRGDVVPPPGFTEADRDEIRAFILGTIPSLTCGD